ncbi:hypothetical protein HMPREF9389_0103 [Streptococcus sanguinis SK355]|uniref:Uncharacterized protein n=1 Tax=Streptococcus sanguinis SK355 TaxID=888816 RepID=F3UMP5_STRSA|nr:hypothetical protein HMPREF9389_0103 [Streptococcus sanguinis SK355]
MNFHQILQLSLVLLSYFKNYNKILKIIQTQFLYYFYPNYYFYTSNLKSI